MNSKTSKNIIAKTRGIALTSLMVMLVLSSSGVAQDIELTPLVGYQMGGRITVREGDLNIVDNPTYGLIIDIPVQYGTGVELLIMNQPTSLELERYDFGRPMGTEKLFDMNVTYLQIGGVYETQKGNVVPFAALSFGAAWFSPNSSRYSDEWRFGLTMGGGAKLFFSKRFGIRLEGRLLFPLMWGGGTMWCGSGGCSVGLASTTSIVQVAFSAGLIIRLGK